MGNSFSSGRYRRGSGVRRGGGYSGGNKNNNYSYNVPYMVEVGGGSVAGAAGRHASVGGDHLNDSVQYDVIASPSMQAMSHHMMTPPAYYMVIH